MDQKRLIICNTSPLINLAEIDLLDLLEVLETLPGVMCIPPGVRDEVVAKSDLFAKAAGLVESVRIQVFPPTDILLVKSLSATLHRGEAECLALSMEHPGSILILDDLAARAMASAKARGRIAALAPAIHDLRTRARFWINSQLKRELLLEAGESD